MGWSTGDVIRRAVRAALAIGLLGGCTGCESPVAAQTAAATNQTPAAAARPAEATPPATPPAASASPAGGLPTPDAAKHSACDDYVKVLSGRGKDLAALGKREVQALGVGSPDLVTCGAVLSDSDALCTKLFPAEHGPSMACRHMWSVFHELRAYPKTHSFMFGQVDWEECRKSPVLPAKSCDAMRDALRANDAAKCKATGDLEAMCRAFISFDKSDCHVSPEIERRAAKAGKAMKEGEGAPSVEQWCKETIDSRKFLAQGLEALAASGPPREREFAKAAVGRADACQSFAQSATQLCLGSASAPSQATPKGQLASKSQGGTPPARGTPAPAAAKPGAP
jgi:hypothetical protein